ncbi:spore germination protein [Evansella halocellulosilytica]|uniref:spore germination protein n=1 Tax=Evansella halocellulosilytica TaxID=2011013 RepID=UPI000BB6CA1F|nr:spore germination protein [Evansella halocellulosilytica]
MSFIKRWFSKNKNNNSDQQPIVEPPAISTYPVEQVMNDNRKYLKDTLSHSEDLVEKQLKLPSGDTLYMYFLNTMAEEEKIENYFYAKLIKIQNMNDLHLLLKNMEATKHPHLSDAMTEVLSGHCILLIDGFPYCYTIETSRTVKRDITQPENEQIIRGGHFGLVENLHINLHLIRQLITHPKLKVQYTTLGQAAKTKVAIVSMDGVCDPAQLEEVHRRLAKVSSKKLISSGVVEEYLEDSIYSPFPQYMSTERPDRCALNILEGKIAVLVDGDATALVLPMTFFSFYHSNDDYNSRWYTGTFFRLIRMLSFIVAVTLPGLYIAIVSFHYEIIPYGMTYVVKNSIEMIPYPPIIEAFIMELTIELIREAGIRLPSPIGQTIGIVGGLVIGDAVVNAGFVSSIMIIVVALTAIASFVVPSHEMSMAVRLLRFPIMIMAALLGFVGIVFCLSLYLIHLCKLTSLGQPYFYPFAPFSLKDLKESIIRIPHTKNKEQSVK